MNWLIRLGQSFERRRVVRHPEFDQALHKIEEILKAHEKINANVEVGKMKMRLDRIELLVGLKREPVATQLPDSPKIS